MVANGTFNMNCCHFHLFTQSKTQTWFVVHLAAVNQPLALATVPILSHTHGPIEGKQYGLKDGVLFQILLSFFPNWKKRVSCIHKIIIQ